MGKIGRHDTPMSQPRYQFHLHAMTCPSCGDEGQQCRVGRLVPQEFVVYHCQACERLYSIYDREDEDDAGGEEDHKE
jgi:hypothetical protein